MGRMRQMNGRRGLLWLSLLVWLSWSSVAWADCYRLYRNNQPEQAGDCFVESARKLGSGKGLSEAQRLRKGRLLRNAALCFDKVAKNLPVENASVLREKAIAQLSLALKEDLLEGVTGKQEALALRSRIEKSIGRMELTLLTGRSDASVCVSAKGWKSCQVGAIWKLKLLPRTHKVVVRYKGGEQQSRTLSPKPFGRIAMVFAPKERASATTVVTNHPEATLTLLSSVLVKPIVAKGEAFSKELKPGTYKLKVLYPNGQSLQRTLKVVEGKPRVVVLRPPGPPVLVVNTTPINAQVYVDGKYRGNSSLRLVLQPGTRTVELRRGCFHIVKRTMEAKANQTYTIASVLKREAVYLQWLNTKQRGPRMMPIGWVVLASGALIAGVGGLMHGLANDRHEQALQARPIRFDTYQQQATEGNTFRTVGYVGLGLGVLGLGAGVTTLLMSRTQTKFQLPCRVRIKPSNDDL
ncbi:MAG: PEGA domain-containing protein [Deltaproteobacteria bacterium]|nr:MAG: PEGA domain-containing protein [Deltaproteobacteria bacterium]